MIREIKLKVQERKNLEGKLEKEDPKLFVPINIYGENFKNRHVKAKAQDLKKIYEIAGESNLVELHIENEEPIKAVFKDIQEDPVKGYIIHADLYKVDMTKIITTEIPLEFFGESEAVKNLGGVLNKSINEVEVECLPGDLVDHIKIDISSLNTFEDVIKMQDIKLPKGMKLTSSTNDVIASVIEPQVEEEVPVETAEEATKEKEDEGEKTEEKAKAEDKEKKQEK